MRGSADRCHGAAFVRHRSRPRSQHGAGAGRRLRKRRDPLLRQALPRHRRSHGRQSRGGHRIEQDARRTARMGAQALRGGHCSRRAVCHGRTPLASNSAGHRRARIHQFGRRYRSFAQRTRLHGHHHHRCHGNGGYRRVLHGRPGRCRRNRSGCRHSAHALRIPRRLPGRNRCGQRRAHRGIAHRRIGRTHRRDEAFVSRGTRRKTGHRAERGGSRSMYASRTPPRR